MIKMQQQKNMDMMFCGILESVKSIVYKTISQMKFVVFLSEQNSCF